MVAKKRSFPISISILGLLVVVGLAVAGYRYANGIGAISNLSDGRGWDLYCGVALASGGFTLAAIVYIFNIKKYYPIVRSAILTAFLGYLMVIFALLVDLGQPWRIWYPIVLHRNLHSPLLEVGWCVTFYTVVLALEFSPMVFERFNLEAPMRIIRSIQIPLVITGIVLSTLHQSSLGSMLLLMRETMNPLWYTPILPILFFFSAVAVGLAMTIVESSLSGRAFGHEVSLDILSGLGKAIPYVLGLFLLLRLGDLLLARELNLLFDVTPLKLLFLVEVIGGAILPMVLFSMESVRQSRTKLFWSAMLVVGGLVLHRFNVSLLALSPRPGTTYFPHWMEIAITVGIVSAGVLAFTLANRYLPVTHHEPAPEAG
jgi:Ni/Fe-hydrogenase subunit HybB-like protein